MHATLQASGGHVLARGNPRPWQATNANYKTDFASLTTVLRGERYADRRVLATFDHTLHVWWTAFEGRFAFVSDPFLSTRPDAELEARFLAFCRELGAPPEKLELLLRDGFFQVMWLSHNKYNLSATQAYAPLSAYPEARRPEPDAVLVGWNIVPPEFEIARMLRQYRERAFAASAFTAPDIIITTAEHTAHNLVPSEARYSRDYANSTFQVWLRR
jgi:hypothetical protein